MKKEQLYDSPSVIVMAILSESAFLTSSAASVEGMGMQELTYEDISWN